MAHTRYTLQNVKRVSSLSTRSNGYGAERERDSGGFLNSHDQGKFSLSMVNETRTKESCQCCVLQPATACCRSQAVGWIEFIRFMNRTAVVELAVRGGVTRRVDRYSWKGSIHQGYNACSKGHSEIKWQAEALGAIVAGVDARRPKQEGTAGSRDIVPAAVTVVEGPQQSAVRPYCSAYFGHPAEFHLKARGKENKKRGPG